MAFDMEEQFSEECLDSGIHEECGVFGAYDLDGNDIASTVYYGLFALQHRGQESCGIAVSDTNGPKKNIQVHKGMGLVNEVFSSENLEKLKGNISVGHVRYSTAGSSTRENAQPLVLNYIKGTLALDGRKLVDFFNEAAYAYLTDSVKYKNTISEIIGGTQNGKN